MRKRTQDTRIFQSGSLMHDLGVAAALGFI